MFSRIYGENYVKSGMLKVGPAKDGLESGNWARHSASVPPPHTMRRHRPEYAAVSGHPGQCSVSSVYSALPADFAAALAASMAFSLSS